MVPFEAARALSVEEIARVIEDYRHAARCAIRAGFDGIELHAANAYLIDQFLRSSVNRRDDAYGGSLENRLRLLVEVVDALRKELPSERIGVRLSPFGGHGGSYDDDPETTYVAAAKSISGKGLAYLHVVRPNEQTSAGAGVAVGNALAKDMRKAFDGVFIVNGGFEPEEAASWVKAGDADAVAFGRLYLANPDLPERIAAGGPYNEADQDTYYGGGREGYVDYPTLRRTETALCA